MRFAPLIRVSTEQQEKKKESLITQQNQIKDYVERLDGTIPNNCWGYCGQEHATSQFEREKLDQLIEDSSKNMFDAVICVDASRWSRDNYKSKEGLEILRNNNIKFFVGTMEYDLYNPEQIFFLSMAVEIGEFQANLGSLKSITTRINKARRGEPATRLPIGRTWDKKIKKWGIDKDLSKKFTDIAQRFVAGEDLAHLGKMIGMSRNTLREILTKRCGDQWEQKFYAKRFNIDEIIPTKVPPLIKDPKLIEAVKARVQANKTVYHSHIKKDKHGKLRKSPQKYLFSRMILCKECGLALFGEFMNQKTRHYRHRATMEEKGHRIPIDCDNFRFVKADLIEEPIMEHIFQMFGDQPKVEEAIKAAIPGISDLKDLETQLDNCVKEKISIERKVETLLDAIEEGKGDTFIKNRLQKYEDRHQALEMEIKKLKDKISNLPSENDIKSQASIIQRMIKGYYKHSKVHYNKMSFEDKRKLLGHIFNGTDQDGNRCGIYIKKNSDGFMYEIRGNFMNDYGWIKDITKIENKPYYNSYFDDLIPFKILGKIAA